MTFLLQTFGSLTLFGSQDNRIAFPEKGLLALAYLLTQPSRTSSRGALAAFLWGKDDSGASLVNLRQTVSRIKARQAGIGVELLAFTDTTVSIGNAPISADFLSMANQTERPVAQVSRIAGCLERTFLPDANCQSDDFDDWLALRNAQHALLLETALRRATALAVGEEEHEAIKAAAVLLFQTQPDNPRTLAFLTEIFNADGEVDFLRQHFEARKQSLARGVDLLRGRSSAKGAAVWTRQQPLPAVPQDGTGSASLNLAPAARPIPRIVLLPPANLSDHAGASAMAMSLVEDITIGFCAFNSLRVIAPHSAIQISRRVEDQQSFLKRHSVSYALETKVRNSGDEIGLYAQLIYLPEDEIVWAERFRLDQADMVRDRRALARRIGLSVSSEIERHETTRSYLELNPIAYQHYLVGKQYLSRLTLPNVRRARREMKAALNASPDFAPALSAIARTYSKEWLLTARGDIELLKTSEAFAKRSIAIRADLADGYREFGVAKLMQHQLEESAEALEIAETLSPHYADIIVDHADTLVHCGRLEPALEKIERAIDLNPLSPDEYLWSAAGASYALSRFENALDYIGRMPDPSLADRLAAASWAMLGETEKAGSLVTRARETNPDFDVDRWLAAVPFKETWQREQYREGLKKAGF